MSDAEILYWFAIPFTAIGALIVIERLALGTGVVAVHRLGIPWRGWTRPLEVEAPTPEAPAGFPVVDQLAPGMKFDRTNDIRARWLGERLITFWDAKARNGINTSGLTLTVLLTIQPTPDATRSTLHVQPYIRVPPWLTLPAVFYGFWLIEHTWWADSGASGLFVFKWIATGLFSLSMVISTIIAERRLRPVVEEIAAELTHRAKTGSPTFDDGDLASELGDGLLDD